jgi:hypothetical protein
MMPGNEREKIIGTLDDLLMKSTIHWTIPVHKRLGTRENFVSMSPTGSDPTKGGWMI